MPMGAAEKQIQNGVDHDTLHFRAGAPIDITACR
jgi:hypothetical protein